jgi:hypothetical protein
MPNKKLREGQPIGMGITAPMGAEKKALKGKVTNPTQPTKAKKPKGGY